MGRPASERLVQVREALLEGLADGGAYTARQMRDWLDESSDTTMLSRALESLHRLGMVHYDLMQRRYQLQTAREEAAAGPQAPPEKPQEAPAARPTGQNPKTQIAPETQREAAGEPETTVSPAHKPGEDGLTPIMRKMLDAAGLFSMPATVGREPSDGLSVAVNMHLTNEDLLELGPRRTEAVMKAAAVLLSLQAELSARL